MHWNVRDDFRLHLVQRVFGPACYLCAVCIWVIPGPVRHAQASEPNIAPPQAQAETSVVIPSYPFWPNDAMVVDSTLVSDMAADYCASNADPSSEGFFYGDLPLASIDALCTTPDAGVPSLLGNLYLSGYFGGIWLRDNLDDDAAARAPTTRVFPWFTAAAQALDGDDKDLGARGSIRPAPAPPGDLSGFGEAPGLRNGSLFQWAMFQAIARAAGAQTKTAQQGGALEVVFANRASLPLLLSIYGYNLGYTMFLLDSPPDGAETMQGILVCDDYVMACYSPAIDLALLDRFWPAITNLQYPPSPRWQRMDALVQEFAAGSVQAGEDVWADIMSDTTISAEAYPMLMTLSTGFLLVSDAAALGGIGAWAAGDTAGGRCALLAQAGLTVWSGSYFMGLVSDAPPGTTPTLQCAGDVARPEEE